MAARFIHVAFTFNGPAPTEALKKVFDGATDWIRYDDHCWILYTTTGIDTWRDRIRKTPGVNESDSFFLCVFDAKSPSSYSGYMQTFVWEWLQKDRTK